MAFNGHAANGYMGVTEVPQVPPKSVSTLNVGAKHVTPVALKFGTGDQSSGSLVRDLWVSTLNVEAPHQLFESCKNQQTSQEDMKELYFLGQQASELAGSPARCRSELHKSYPSEHNKLPRPRLTWVA